MHVLLPHVSFLQPFDGCFPYVKLTVETKADSYTGWVEESKVIKFTLEGK